MLNARKCRKDKQQCLLFDSSRFSSLFIYFHLIFFRCIKIDLPYPVKKQEIGNYACKYIHMYI